MAKAVSVIWRGTVDTYNELFPMVGMNLVWVGLSLLLGLILSPLWIILSQVGVSVEMSSIFFLILIVFCPNPAAAGIHEYVNNLVKEERVEFSLVWSGLRRYALRGLALFAISAAGFIVTAVNVSFYLASDSQILKILGIICIYITYIWLSMQMYVMPLLIEQENKSIKLVLRNAAIIALDNPLVTLTLIVILGALTVLSVAIPILIMLLAGSLIRAIQHRATLTLLEKYRARQASRSSGA